MSIERVVIPPERIAELADSAVAQIAWCRGMAQQLVDDLATCTGDAERRCVLTRALSAAMLSGVDIGIAIADNAYQRVVMRRGAAS